MPSTPSLAPLTLITGDEELLVTRAVARLVATARAVDAEADVREYAAESLELASLLDLMTPSLFGETRLVVVRLSGSLDDTVRDAVLDLVASAGETVSVGVVHPGGNTGKRIVDACKAAGAAVVTCAKVDKLRDRVDFVMAEFAGCDCPVSESVARALLEAVGNDLRELAGACSQLVADTGGAVDAKAVARYFSGRAEASGFGIADRALEGNESAALIELRQATQSGLDPVLVVAALARQLRTVARVASEGPRAPVDAVARKLKLAPWMVEKARRQARGWTPETIARAFQAVADADAAVKGGGQEGALILSPTRSSFAAERAVREVAACGSTR
ncbi:MAG TPA: DNA polymerase III subunit delta [Mycobacteriales bacterium]|nr:DNA polymerase III subunit delta [Mycobacteriales bacterium]